MQELNLENHEDSEHEGISAIQNARATYLGYAVLARLSGEHVVRGEQDIDAATDSQAERLHVAFASASQVLMEIRGLAGVEMSIELTSGVNVNTNIAIVQAESLKHSLPRVGKRYLASMVGPVDDIVLHDKHIPAIVDALLSLHGEALRVERRTLDMEKLLSLRFAGLSTEEIASNQGTIAKRVKGAFLRFYESVSKKVSLENRQKVFRDRLEEVGLLEYASIPTSEELDTNLPSRALKKPSPRKNKTPHTKVVVPGKVHITTDPIRPEKPPTFPDDLLVGETMSDRRRRLREEDAESPQ